MYHQEMLPSWEDIQQLDLHKGSERLTYLRYLLRREEEPSVQQVYASTIQQIEAHISSLKKQRYY